MLHCSDAIKCMECFQKNKTIYRHIWCKDSHIKNGYLKNILKILSIIFLIRLSDLDSYICMHLQLIAMQFHFEQQPSKSYVSINKGIFSKKIFWFELNVGVESTLCLVEDAWLYPQIECCVTSLLLMFGIIINMLNSYSALLSYPMTLLFHNNLHNPPLRFALERSYLKPEFDGYFEKYMSFN